MRTTKFFTLSILCMAALLGLGCQRLMNQDAAIQKAIRDHLTERSDLDMSKMVLEIRQVKVDGDKAQAEVVFRTTSDPPAQMSYHYELHREGGAWKVDTGRPSAADTQHPQMGQAAGEAGGESQGEPQGGQLPAGHPPINQAPIGQTNPHGDAPPPSSQQQ
jgi:hypothetical protein